LFRKGVSSPFPRVFYWPAVSSSIARHNISGLKTATRLSKEYNTDFFKESYITILYIIIYKPVVYLDDHIHFFLCTAAAVFGFAIHIWAICTLHDCLCDFSFLFEFSNEYIYYTCCTITHANTLIRIHMYTLYTYVLYKIWILIISSKMNREQKIN